MHFGETPVKCGSSCDICVNKKAVEKMIEDFHIACVKYSSIECSNDVSFDLYERGRHGQHEYCPPNISPLFLYVMSENF